MRSKEQIEDVIKKVSPLCEKENVSPGCTYQDGVVDALEWVLGSFADNEFDFENDEKQSK